MKENLCFKKEHLIFIIVVWVFLQTTDCASKTLPEKTGSQWYPHLEWEIENVSVDSNPFDLEARVEFTHSNSGRSITTPMFYAGRHSWRFRFTATLTGQWSFRTFSGDADLDGWTGKVEIGKNKNPQAHGFITAIGNKWAWQGKVSCGLRPRQQSDRSAHGNDRDAGAGGY